jgi:hypothetical protein
MLVLKSLKSLYLPIFLVWAGLVCYLSFPDPQGTDFFPVWTCSRAVLVGEDPYSTSMTEKLSDTWDIVRKKRAQVAPVCAYPLPFYLITLPFGALPFAASLTLWFALSLATPIVFILFRNTCTRLPWVPLLFYPLFHGALLKTSSVLWVGFFAGAIFLLLNKQLLWAALLAGIASAKPQIGAMLFLYSLVLFSRVEARTRTWPVIILFSPWIASWIYDPTWLKRWFVMLQSYEDKAVLFSFLSSTALIPLIALSSYVFYKISPFAAVAAVQFLIFPINDLYSCLPIMLCWAFIKPPQFWLILITTLIPLTYAEPNQLWAVRISAFLPLLLAAIWQLMRSQVVENSNSYTRRSFHQRENGF